MTIVSARRWPVVSALGIVQIFSWGSTYYLLAVLAGPIAQDTGWPPRWIIGALSIGFMVAAVLSPRVGSAIARVGGRRVLAAGCILISAGLFILALATALWVFILGWAVIGAGMAAGLYDPAFATLGRLYGRDARRSISALTLWGGFASTVCWPLSALLLTEVGWRGTAAAYAIWHICVSLPLVLWFIPREDPLSSPVGRRNEPALRLSPDDRAAFVLTAAILVTSGLVSTIVSVHLLTFLIVQGQNMTAAVALGTLIGPAQVGARLLEMAGGGRHHPIWTMAAAVLFIALGLLLLTCDLPFPGLALVLYGGGNGLFSIARGALPMSFFGPERYAQIMGRLARPALIAQAVAPLIAALLIERTGPFITLAVVAFFAIVNVALMAALALNVRQSRPSL